MARIGHCGVTQGPTALKPSALCLVLLPLFTVPPVYLLHHDQWLECMEWGPLRLASFNLGMHYSLSTHLPWLDTKAALVASKFWQS